MPETDRPFSSLIIAFLLFAGGLITLAAGFGYLDDESVSGFVAGIDIVGGIALVIGAVCILCGRQKPNLWKLTLATLIVEAIAGVAMMTVTIVGGIVLIVICACFVWWLFTTASQRWFGV